VYSVHFEDSCFDPEYKTKSALGFYTRGMRIIMAVALYTVMKMKPAERGDPHVV
jgi:hypothetical protein